MFNAAKQGSFVQQINLLKVNRKSKNKTFLQPEFSTGCQMMVSFLTKNNKLGKFWRTL
jgi:hypothetical protein